MPDRLPAFSAYGIELEYMLVDRDTLNVRPIADKLLAALPSAGDAIVDCSNELVNHVIEIKNPVPTDLANLPAAFQQQIRQLNAWLAEHNACLMPTAMHPWMNPAQETQLWPHDDADIYSTFDALFDCKRHSWANVQSMHINLPFANDSEFEKLHTAIRMLLPILPAIAASSPIADGQATGYLDYRMHVYRDQSPDLPRIVGDVIPELMKSEPEYRSNVLEPIYQEIAPLDPQRTLQFEWLNARGAIARFDRHAIEIRVMDVQECPQADIALAALVIDIIHALYHQHFSTLALQQALPRPMLSNQLAQCSRDAEEAEILAPAYRAAWGYPGEGCTAKELWRYIGEVLQQQGSPHIDMWKHHLDYVLEKGSLGQRILAQTGEHPSATILRNTYKKLTQILDAGAVFDPLTCS